MPKLHLSPTISAPPAEHAEQSAAIAPAAEKTGFRAMLAQASAPPGDAKAKTTLPSAARPKDDDGNADDADDDAKDSATSHDPPADLYALLVAAPMLARPAPPARTAISAHVASSASTIDAAPTDGAPTVTHPISKKTLATNAASASQPAPDMETAMRRVLGEVGAWLQPLPQGEASAASLSANASAGSAATTNDASSSATGATRDDRSCEAPIATPQAAPALAAHEIPSFSRPSVNVDASRSAADDDSAPASSTIARAAPRPELPSYSASFSDPEDAAHVTVHDAAREHARDVEPSAAHASSATAPHASNGARPGDSDAGNRSGAGDGDRDQPQKSRVDAPPPGVNAVTLASRVTPPVLAAMPAAPTTPAAPAAPTRSPAAPEIRDAATRVIDETARLAVDAAQRAAHIEVDAGGTRVSVRVRVEGNDVHVAFGGVTPALESEIKGRLSDLSTGLAQRGFRAGDVTFHAERTTAADSSSTSSHDHGSRSDAHARREEYARDDEPPPGSRVAPTTRSATAEPEVEAAPQDGRVHLVA